MVESEKDRRIVRDRRQRPTKPFSRYMIFGRRRSIRRRTDRKTHRYVDLYGHYLLLSLLLIILLSIFDAYFTIFHVGRGAWEVNPFMNFLIDYGNIYFFTMKYIITVLCLVMLCIYKNLFIARTGILFILFLYLVVFTHHIFLIFLK